MMSQAILPDGSAITRGGKPMAAVVVYRAPGEAQWRVSGWRGALAAAEQLAGTPAWARRCPGTEVRLVKAVSA